MLGGMKLMKMLKSFYMKPNRKNTKNVLIDLSYDGSMNEFEEFYGFSITYQELEQQSYIEFKEMMFEYINKKIKFRKFGRIGHILTVRAEMYDSEIEELENLILKNKIKTIYGWIAKDVTLINEEEHSLKLSIINEENNDYYE